MAIKISPFVYFFPLIVFLISCRAEEKKEVGSNQSRIQEREQITSSDAKKVTLTGKTDDLYASEYFNLLDFSHFGFTPYEKPHTRQLLEDSLWLMLSEVD